MKNSDNLHKMIIAVAILVAALSVAYYFVILLPQQEKSRVQREELIRSEDLGREEIAKQEQEAVDFKNIAKEIQEDCIDKAKNTSDDFDLENTYSSPLFYPYDDAYSFNKNERLTTALDSYESCIDSDPRYSSNNAVLQEIYYDAQYARVTIKEHMAKIKENNSGLCEASALTVAGKRVCDNLGSLEDIVRSRMYLTQRKNNEYKTEEETQKSVDSYMRIIYSDL